MTAFKSVVLDVDSTVSAIEGIDWLASLRGADVTKLVESLTNDAMEERVPLDEVYERRLALIRPTRSELQALSAMYITAALPGAQEAVQAWKNAGVRVVLVSGGLRDAILPLANWLGIQEVDVHAVDVSFDNENAVTDVAHGSLLARRGGKPLVVEALTLERPLLAVGDGATDADLTAIADRFVAFTGVVRRAAVVARAHSEVDSFAALTPMVLGL